MRQLFVFDLFLGVIWGMKKRINAVLMAVIMLLVSVAGFSNVSLAAAPSGIVIVIDPGHGGLGDKNLGAVHNGLTEKDLTLAVANAMKAELEKYDNVTVYMTRTGDSAITLEERAEYAKSVNADFMYSIHFNASGSHEFYGSEVWTSAFGKYYQKGYDFGVIESEELANLGLYQKGVKTRIGKKGDDYYGIIRHSVSRDIPCALIEHCYMDHAYDLQYIRSGDFCSQLGVADATAVAKYFHLSSSVNGNDFSGYVYDSVGVPSGVMRPDMTDPTCSINVLAYDKESRNVLVEMTASDDESPVIYFAYSYDGGQNFYLLQMWDRTKETQSFNVTVPSSVTNARIVCRAYNNYQLYGESNEVDIATR